MCHSPTGFLFRLQVGLLVLLSGFGSFWHLATAAIEPDECLGDEQFSFAPVAPSAGEEMLIAVTSARKHRGTYLTGTSRASLVGEHEGRKGFVWQFTTVPRWEGPHRFQFFVDSTTFCGESVVLVGPNLRLQAIASARQAEASSSNENADDNDNDNDDGNGNGNANENESSSSKKASTPRISAVLPAVSCAGGRLTIRGSGFGGDRGDVDGSALISGLQVSAYLLWRKDRIDLLVPKGADLGPTDVFVITRGGFAQEALTIGPSPC